MSVLTKTIDCNFVDCKSSSFLMQKQQQISVITGCILNHFYDYCSIPIKNPKHWIAQGIKLELWYTTSYNWNP